MEFTIKLNSVQDVQNFVALATSCPFPVMVKDARHQVNGKSFMEMFCLDFNHPLTVVPECDADAFWHLKSEADCFLAY